MKFHKLMSRTVIATALLGATIGIGFSGSNVSASNTNTIQNTDGQPIEPVARSGSESFDTKSGNGNSNIQINTNTLTLDSVPVLNFGQNSNNDFTQSGSNVLPLNDSDNGNDSRKLEVTDYRKNDGSHNTNQWNLTASMGTVTQTGGDSNQQKTNQLWQMNLTNKPQNFNGSSTSDGSNIPNGTNSSTQLTSDNGNGTNNGDETIMSTNGSGNNGYGVNQIIYNNKTANLNIPNVSPGSYSTSITWKLNTSVSAQDNNVS